MLAIRLERQLTLLGSLEPRRQVSDLRGELLLLAHPLFFSGLLLLTQSRPRLDERRSLIDQFFALGLPCCFRFVHRGDLGSQRRFVCLLVAPTFAGALYLSQLLAGCLEPLLQD